MRSRMWIQMPTVQHTSAHPEVCGRYRSSMNITELTASGRTWPHPVPSPDGRIVGPDGVHLPMPFQAHPLLAQMARFVDGPEHTARRTAVLAALPTAQGLEHAARRCTVAELGGADRVDVVPIARTVPVRVLGEALGVGDLSDSIGALCDRGEVTAELPDIAVTSLLFQSRDATAALIVNALADAVAVEQADSVVLTRRAGDVWVLLDGIPFGAGAHACPGREHALAVARGVVSAFNGYAVTDRGPHEPRPNIRMPSHLILQRR